MSTLPPELLPPRPLLMMELLPPTVLRGGSRFSRACATCKDASLRGGVALRANENLRGRGRQGIFQRQKPEEVPKREQQDFRKSYAV